MPATIFCGSRCLLVRGHPNGRARVHRVITTFILVACLPGCGGQEAQLARYGKVALIGLNQSELRVCAGFPAKNEKDKDGEVWMYEHGASMPGGYTAPGVGLPWGGSISGNAPNGYCRAQFRFVAGRVTEVPYAGETDLWGNRDAVCAQIIRNCLDRLQARGGTDAR